MFGDDRFSVLTRSNIDCGGFLGFSVSKGQRFFVDFTSL